VSRRDDRIFHALCGALGLAPARGCICRACGTLRRMPLSIFLKLLAIFAVVGLGYAAGRGRWLSGGEQRSDVARLLSNAAFLLFMPALLFRTTARIDLTTLPWSTLAAFFGPLLLMILGCYAWQRRAAASPVAAPAVRAMSMSFGNTVMLGIPVAAALFGEGGLALHVAIVSMHALILLMLLTTLAELDLARSRSLESAIPHHLGRMLMSTVRVTVIHPVVTPLLAGLAWNLTGLALPEAVDEFLKLLGQAGIPLSLVIIGLSFAEQGTQGLRAMAGGALWLTAGKLLLLPLLVLAAGHWIVGLDGIPLAVVVMCAALPTGANALIFAQRYNAHVGEAATVTVMSTLCFAVTAPLWLLVLSAEPLR
jgi:malonate transporter